MNNNNIFESLKLQLSEALDKELYFPIKEELSKQNISHSLGYKKEIFKSRMEELIDNLSYSLSFSYNVLQDAIISYYLRIEKYRVSDNVYQINNIKVLIENNHITLNHITDNSTIILTPQEFELIKLIRSNKE